MTIPIGLGIGRLVFRALNLAEAVWAVVVVAAVAAGDPPTGVVLLTACVVALLAVQLCAVRPLLNRRSDRVLAAGTGEDAPRSRAHLYYVALEMLKVVALIALGISVLTR